MTYWMTDLLRHAVRDGMGRRPLPRSRARAIDYISGLYPWQLLQPVGQVSVPGGPANTDLEFYVVRPRGGLLKHWLTAL